jgi:hypothetical protein
MVMLYVLSAGTVFIIAAISLSGRRGESVAGSGRTLAAGRV